MGWLKWLIGAIVALFLYFGASQLLTTVVTGTTSSDAFVTTVVPLILALVGLAIPVFALGEA